MTQKLHILFICGWFPSKVSPTNGDFIQRHAEAVATKHAVSVIHIISDEKTNKEYIEINQENGVNIYIGYVRKTNNPLVKIRRFWKIFHQILKKLGTFDVVHLNEIYPFGIFALYLKKKLKKPYIISEHWTGYQLSNSKQIGFFQKIISKKITKNANFVCPVSQNLASAMQQFGLKGNYTIVPNVVNTNLFKPLKIQNTEFKIIHISSLLDKHKNISGMLRVAKKLENKIDNFTWKFAGGTSKEFSSLLNTLNFTTAKIEFKNHIPQEKLVEELQNSNLFVLFSNFENLPCVILESFACGIPVISTDVGGIKEFFPNDFGVLIAKENEKALVEAIVNQYQSFKKNNQQNKNKMYNYAVKNFSQTAIENQFSKLYLKSLL